MAKYKMLTIGVPCHRDLRPSWAYNFKTLSMSDKWFESWQLLMPQGMLVDEARNYIVDKMQGDWLLFIDSDVMVPSDTIDRLMAHDKPIVSGLYFQRNPPFNPHIYRKSDAPGRWDSKLYYEENKLIPIDSAGLGCCLIKREVFDAIGTKEENKPIPWFKFTTGYGEAHRESEDHYFFRRAAEEGYQAYCDTSVACGHIGDEIITEQHFKAMLGDRFTTNKPQL